MTIDPVDITVDDRGDSTECCPICLCAFKKDETLEEDLANLSTTAHPVVKTCAMCGCRVHTSCFRAYMAHPDSARTCLICRNDLSVLPAVRPTADVGVPRTRRMHLVSQYLSRAAVLAACVALYVVMGWLGKFIWSLIEKEKQVDFNPFTELHLWCSIIGTLTLCGISWIVVTVCSTGRRYFLYLFA